MVCHAPSQKVSLMVISLILNTVYFILLSILWEVRHQCHVMLKLKGLVPHSGVKEASLILWNIYCLRGAFCSQLLEAAEETNFIFTVRKFGWFCIYICFTNNLSLRRQINNGYAAEIVITEMNQIILFLVMYGKSNRLLSLWHNGCCCVHLVIGALCKHSRNTTEKRGLRFSKWFKLSNATELFWSWNLWDEIQVEVEKGNFTVLCLDFNLTQNLQQTAKKCVRMCDAHTVIVLSSDLLVVAS